MRTMTATSASRGFSAMLDAVEHEAEEFIIERDGRPVAKVSPVPLFSGAGFNRALTELGPNSDSTWGEELEEIQTLLTWSDPWKE
ncbi:MAG: type II toxin-antitoxin system Phd/YefM family antitoxin [Promicromonosporaceae bacterium]|nr:type II toxin-antitoxin system Phd/YefM family antitoxin [Promicromonosporaceae bacterium]